MQKSISEVVENVGVELEEGDRGVRRVEQMQCSRK